MMKFILYLMCIMMCLFVGTLDLYSAIDSFNKQKYGWFSWYIMLTLWMTSLLFRTVFNGV